LFRSERGDIARHVGPDLEVAKGYHWFRCRTALMRTARRPSEDLALDPGLGIVDVCRVAAELEHRHRLEFDEPIVRGYSDEDAIDVEGRPAVVPTRDDAVTIPVYPLVDP